MAKYDPTKTEKSPRIELLKAHLFEHMPVIESARARLITESYRRTEGESVYARRSKAFAYILDNIPIIIRPYELIAGSSTIAPRGCQTYPEYSYTWLDEELDTVEKRAADPFYVAEETKKELREVHRYWAGKTNYELARSYMAPEAVRAMEHGVFTTGNYFYNGIGHLTVQYDQVLAHGFAWFIERARKSLDELKFCDPHYARKHQYYLAVIRSCEAVIRYAKRYSELAGKEAAACSDPVRKQELLQIAENCRRVPEHGASTFWEACQSFWFVQQLLQLESSGHSISPGRFDQYMYPYYRADMDARRITRDFAQELMDCVWVKFNDLNKVRDKDSAEGFAGYSLFQNLIAGGQDGDGEDVTNDLSFLCIWASMHVNLPQPSFCVRVWNKTPQDFMIAAAELVRTGLGQPAYYNDEVIIPSLMNRGLTLREAREYNIIGCVEPQIAGKTDGWHDAAFFNICRPLELVFSNGMDKGEMIGIPTGDVTRMSTFDEFYHAYERQMKYCISLLVNSDNAIDQAHSERVPLPWQSCMVDDCMALGKTNQEGGAHYNFTGPQGFGIANVADGLFAIRKLVYEDKSVTMAELRDALAANFGKGMDAAAAEKTVETIVSELVAAGQKIGEEEVRTIAKMVASGTGTDARTARFQEIRRMIEACPKYGNDLDEVDALAKKAGKLYSETLETFSNPRGGRFQAGMYPVSANVPLGRQTGATPDGRYAGTPIADGVSPCQGKDTHGPTAASNSVAKLDHALASNGTLYNMKFHPSALSGREGLVKFSDMIRAFFDQKGMHVQFNVVDRQTLLDAQKHPEKYRQLVVRVAGYSALFTTLSKSLQDDIISRTEQALQEV